MDEFQHYERLDVDGDFEGGQWIGGEFVYTKRKRGAQQTEDDRLYGVFQGSSGEEDDGEDAEGFLPIHKRKRKSGRSVHKEVAFVSKGVVTDTTEAVTDEDDSNEEVKEAVANDAQQRPGAVKVIMAKQPALPKAPSPLMDTSRTDNDQDLTGVARMIKRAGEQKRLEAEAALGAEAQRRRTLRMDPEMAKFESHGRGIGSKLMRAMGWKPGEGLGSERTGIAKPVEATLRPKGAGLGAAGSEGPQKDHVGSGAPDKKGKPLPASTAAAAAEPSAFKLAWRADRRRELGARDVYKTAEEVLREREEEASASAAAAARSGGPLAAAAPMTILDMTGPTARLVKDVSELSAAGAGGSRAASGGREVEGAAFPELQHNLALLVDLAEADIAKLDARARRERDAAVALREEEARLAAQADEVERELERTAQMLEVVEVVDARREVAPVEADELLAIYASLREEHPVEFQLFDLAALALSQLLPTLQAATTSWAPLEEPLKWLPTFSAWKPLLHARPADAGIGSSTRADDSGAAVGAPHSTDPCAGDPFSELVTGTLFPPLRRAVMGQWDPLQPGAMLTFADHWTPVLPAALTTRILRALILPRLRRALELWDPSAAAAAAGSAAAAPLLLHAWLHPWLPHLEPDIAELYPMIRSKLAAMLQVWRPWDGTAKRALAPWHRLWRPRDWVVLTDRVVVPPLEAAMHELLSLNPLSHDTRPCDWVREWIGLLSPPQLAGIYERAFFPEAHRVLYTWLSHAGVIHDEVWTWLDGVKAAHIPPVALQDDRIRHQIAAAVNAISSSQQGHPLPLGYPAIPPLEVATALPGGGIAGASYGATGGGTAAAAAAAALTQAEAELERKGIKEYLSEHAQEAGLSFVPRRGRLVAGMQVYALGTLSVVVDVHAGVVKAFLEDRWVPMALEEVVQAALKRGR